MLGALAKERRVLGEQLYVGLEEKWESGTHTCKSVKSEEVVLFSRIKTSNPSSAYDAGRTA